MITDLYNASALVLETTKKTTKNQTRRIIKEVEQKSII